MPTVSNILQKPRRKGSAIWSGISKFSPVLIPTVADAIEAEGKIGSAGKDEDKSIAVLILGRDLAK